MGRVCMLFVTMMGLASVPSAHAWWPPPPLYYPAPVYVVAPAVRYYVPPPVIVQTTIVQPAPVVVMEPEREVDVSRIGMRHRKKKVAHRPRQTKATVPVIPKPPLAPLGAPLAPVPLPAK
jgi:hypothetical protein